MKKIILICLFAITIIGFSKPERDNRGILTMNENEWYQMFGDNTKTNGKCSFIGASIMQLAYINDGKKLETTQENALSSLEALNRQIYSEGLRHPSNDNSLLFEYYYAKNCRKLTNKDFDLVGSPSFKTVFEEIYNTYK